METGTRVNSALLTVRRGVAALVLLTCLVYASALGGGFIWDDESVYLDNPRLIYQTTLKSAFTSDLYAVLRDRVPYPYYRPLAFLSYAWLGRLTGLQPFWLHLASVIMHAAAGLLVFFLVLEFAEIRVAWLSAALFVAHPLHVEAVAWMAAFPEVLAGALMLLSLYALIRARRGPKWLLAVSYLAAALSFFTKENALALPLAAAVFVGWRAWPFFAIAAGTLLVRFLVLGFGYTKFAVAQLPPSWLNRMLAVTLQYGKKMFWPWPLAPEYYLVHSPAAWLAFAVACILAGWLAYRSSEARRSLLLLVIFLSPAVATSIFLPALRAAQDRYAYGAVLGICLLLGYTARHHAGLKVALALLVVWSALSVVTILHWRDGEALAKHTLRVTPYSKTAVMTLGEWYFMTGQFEEADRIFQQGLLLRPKERDYLLARAALRKHLQPAAANSPTKAP